MTNRPGFPERISHFLSPSAKQLLTEARKHRETRVRFPRTRAVRVVTIAVLAVPVAWLFGVAEFVWPILVLPMALYTATRGRVVIPRSFLIWLGFLALVLIAAVGAGSGLHVATTHLSATVIFLFAYNATADELPSSVIVALVAVYWLVLVGGGVLGLVFGTTEFPSVGNALIAANSPEGTWLDEVTLVQFSDPLKVGEQAGLIIDHRPKGFMPYANHWGSAIVMFVAAIGLFRMSLQTGRLSRFVDAAAVAAIVPFVISRNRWTWLSLVALLVYVVVRLWAPQPRIAKAALAALIAFLLTVALTPLGGVVVDRLEGESSNQFRSEQYRLSWDLIQESPWLGFGVNQVSEEAAVVGGVEIEGLRLGSDSQVLQTMINHGIPALVLLVFWLVMIIWATRSMTTPIVALAHFAAVVAVVHTPFYILMPHRWMILMLVAGAAFRQLHSEGHGRAMTVWSKQSTYEAQVRRRRRRRLPQDSNTS